MEERDGGIDVDFGGQAGQPRCMSSIIEKYPCFHQLFPPFPPNILVSPNILASLCQWMDGGGEICGEIEREQSATKVR